MSRENESLDQIFGALANPTRRAILAHLARSEATVNEIAEPFDMSLPAISKHLRVLERAGLIVQGRRAQYRPCRLDVRPLVEVSDWVDRHRALWQERFQRMDDYVRQLQEAN